MLHAREAGTRRSLGRDLGSLESTSLNHTCLREARMPRGDELHEEFRLSDRDDDADDLGYGGGGGGTGGGGSSYDDDEDEEGGWTGTRGSDDLWDSTDELDDEADEAVTLI